MTKNEGSGGRERGSREAPGEQGFCPHPAAEAVDFSVSSLIPFYLSLSWPIIEVQLFQKEVPC